MRLRIFKKKPKKDKEDSQEDSESQDELFNEEDVSATSQFEDDTFLNDGEIGGDLDETEEK